MHNQEQYNQQLIHVPFTVTIVNVVFGGKYFASELYDKGVTSPDYREDSVNDDDREITFLRPTNKNDTTNEQYDTLYTFITVNALFSTK